jgi:hypothetical protein
MKGSIRPHVAKDGTVTWRVRIDTQYPDDPRSQPQRTFRTEQEAYAALEKWKEELAAGGGLSPAPSRRALWHGLPPEMFPPTIYFVSAETLRAIKIGYSTDVAQRVRDLQAATADTLLLLGMHEGDRATEKALHKRFARLHIKGEWYANRRPLRLYIERHAFDPWAYYQGVCPDHQERVTRWGADIFGPDLGHWDALRRPKKAPQ